MIGVLNTDPNKVVPIGLVFKTESGPLMVIGFTVFNNTLSVLVRNMDTGGVSDYSYPALIPIAQKAMCQPHWS